MQIAPSSSPQDPGSAATVTFRMRRRITFRGRVQGVGFRATARSIARTHPVTGWVRNEPDGSVLLEVQGPLEAQDAFLAALRGVMGRSIHDSNEMPVPDAAGESGFEIRS